VRVFIGNMATRFGLAVPDRAELGRFAAHHDAAIHQPGPDSLRRLPDPVQASSPLRDRASGNPRVA
jgi:hypothetical protein